MKNASLRNFLYLVDYDLLKTRGRWKRARDFGHLRQIWSDYKRMCYREQTHTSSKMDEILML